MMLGCSSDLEISISDRILSSRLRTRCTAFSSVALLPSAAMDRRTSIIDALSKTLTDTSRPEAVSTAENTVDVAPLPSNLPNASCVITIPTS